MVETEQTIFTGWKSLRGEGVLGACRQVWSIDKIEDSVATSVGDRVLVKHPDSAGNSHRCTNVGTGKTKSLEIDGIDVGIVWNAELDLAIHQSTIRTSEDKFVAVGGCEQGIGWCGSYGPIHIFKIVVLAYVGTDGEIFILIKN